jgi:hypothetical protein
MNWTTFWHSPSRLLRSRLALGCALVILKLQFGWGKPRKQLVGAGACFYDRCFEALGSNPHVCITLSDKCRSANALVP